MAASCSTVDRDMWHSSDIQGTDRREMHHSARYATQPADLLNDVENRRPISFRNFAILQHYLLLARGSLLVPPPLVCRGLPLTADITTTHSNQAPLGEIFRLYDNVSEYCTGMRLAMVQMADPSRSVTRNGRSIYVGRMSSGTSGQLACCAQLLVRPHTDLVLALCKL